MFFCSDKKGEGYGHADIFNTAHPFPGYLAGPVFDVADLAQASSRLSPICGPISVLINKYRPGEGLDFHKDDEFILGGGEVPMGVISFAVGAPVTVLVRGDGAMTSESKLVDAGEVWLMSGFPIRRAVRGVGGSGSIFYNSRGPSRRPPSLVFEPSSQ